MLGSSPRIREPPQHALPAFAVAGDRLKHAGGRRGDKNFRHNGVVIGTYNGSCHTCSLQCFRQAKGSSQINSLFLEKR